MIHVTMPDTADRRLSFFLAAEEWIARSLPAGEYFFAWRVGPTVICGRNQDVKTEVDLDFCREHGIDVVRRRSGGGAVFADKSNVMFSYISPTDDMNAAFAHYSSMMAEALQSLGFDAIPSGRNDIEIGGRKVAGNACRKHHGCSIVHGTMLYDTDIELMSGALTPSRAKLESHRVQSVPARITTLCSIKPELTVDALIGRITATLCDSQLTLVPAVLPEIENGEQIYRAERFI